MKFLNIGILAGMLVLTACDKTLEEKQVTLDVISTNVKGQTSSSFTENDTIVYKFSGLHEVITYYSGEPGKRYEFKDRTSAKGTPKLKFNSQRANGAQANALKLLISSDFQGVVAKSKTSKGVVTQDTAGTMANILKANWKDITDRAAWPTNTAVLNSGDIDLSDFADQGKPVFIAFKYKVAAGTAQDKWTISTLSLNNYLPDNSVYTQANFAAANQNITNYGVNIPGLGWLSTFDPDNNVKKYRWVYTAAIGTGGSLVITGAANAPAATDAAEAWAIMGPIDLRKVSPDAGSPIKDINKILESYSVLPTYKEGEYTATFVASNTTVKGTSVAVKQLPVKITKP
ncbi:DUF5017 domain-containing protein [Pedobacter nyackensis]|uniref:DUF5017 domain-containing protein n=1 Tax=Pedobacter nyackensis TaxID=475255 RepID=UPI0029308330|nr:DUF5017 domain-containing protein [Pedobacter nyackensis]